MKFKKSNHVKDIGDLCRTRRIYRNQVARRGGILCADRYWKSAFHLSEAIQQVKPDIVINQGTAGTINHQVGDVFVCRHFVDRDMHKMTGLGMEYRIDSSELLAARGFCQHWTESATCNTGDSFLTELTDIEGDVVDMEAYAQAFVCRAKEIPFISVKYVSDVIGQNSVKHWEDRLEDARAGLSHFFNVLKESI